MYVNFDNIIQDDDYRDNNRSECTYSYVLIIEQQENKKVIIDKQIAYSIPSWDGSTK